MTKAKVSHFDADLVKIAHAAKALAHPARLHILSILAERDACICGEIVEASPLAQSTVSQHLKELKQEGLVEGQVEGPRICYCLNKNAVAEAKRAFSHFFLALERPNRNSGARSRCSE